MDLINISSIIDLNAIQNYIFYCIFVHINDEITHLLTDLKLHLLSHWRCSDLARCSGNRRLDKYVLDTMGLFWRMVCVLFRRYIC